MSLMVLLEAFIEKSKNKSIKVGIGAGKSQKQIRIIIDGIAKYLSYNQVEITLFGYQFDDEDILLKKINNKSKYLLKFITSESPERKMLNLLSNHKLDAVIRGGLSSHKFLTTINTIFNRPQINRLALLETINGHQFFFVSFGIYDCNDFDAKILFLKQALKFFSIMNLKPIVRILSGGRKGDIGRDSDVDHSIRDAEELVNHLNNEFTDLDIIHNEILIEKAIAEGSNLILAPNGISGNLIYRTLVHLGGGKAYGAIYLGLEPIIIDTSRVGKSSEIEGALILANGLYS